MLLHTYLPMYICNNIDNNYTINADLYTYIVPIKPTNKSNTITTPIRLLGLLKPPNLHTTTMMRTTPVPSMALKALCRRSRATATTTTTRGFSASRRLSASNQIFDP